MIPTADLRKLARARLQDSEILFRNKRYDGAVYLCGYAVEIALKARICRTLKWQGFPSTPNEFKSLQSYKTHDLDVLLSLTGMNNKIKNNYLAEWSFTATWDPEVRYKSIGSASNVDALFMIESTKTLLRVL